jgi:hypothetical protein
MEETITQEATTQTTETQATDTPAPRTWKWADGVDGTGDKPDFFKDTKYKSIADQAKAYSELEKRFGGFVGAPDEYQLPEEVGITTDDPILKAVLPTLKGANASNEFVNELVSNYAKAQQEMEAQRVQNEIKALGDNADYRIKAISDFATANLPKELQEDFKGLVTTAKGVEVFEALMQKITGGKVAPSETTSQPEMNRDKLREMMFAKNEHGQLKMSIDPEYKKKVDSLYAQFNGGN